jgi:hypothetical protein
MIDLSKLSEILPHIKIVDQTIYASTLLNKRNFPIVRIDSKKPIKAIMFKQNNGLIEIHSIVNNTQQRGFYKQIIPLFKNNIIKINSNQNPEFWNKIILSYPTIKFIV